VQDDAAIRVILVRPPRAHHVESFWFRWRSHLKEQISTSSFLNYCIAGVLLLILLTSWRTFFSKPVLVIAPFSVPVGGEAVIGLSGKSAANLLLDKVEELSKEANDYGKGTSTAPFLNTERPIDMPDVKLEVAGLSVEGVVGFASRLLEKQQVVTGEVYWVKEGVLIRARLEEVWTVGPFAATSAELDKQYRSLAKSLLSVTNPNIAGLIFQKDHEIDSALKSYRAWLSIKGLDNNSRAQAYFHLGVVSDLSGDHLGAQQSYQNALLIQPAFFEALVNLGLNLYKVGNTREAIERLTQASNVKPGSLMPLMIIGLAQGDPSEKEKTYRKALALYPEMPEIHYELARALQQLNRQKEADAELKLYSELQEAKAKVSPPAATTRH